MMKWSFSTKPLKARDKKQVMYITMHIILNLILHVQTKVHTEEPIGVNYSNASIFFIVVCFNVKEKGKIRSNSSLRQPVSPLL